MRHCRLAAGRVTSPPARSPAHHQPGPSPPGCRPLVWSLGLSLSVLCRVLNLNIEIFAHGSRCASPRLTGANPRQALAGISHTAQWQLLSDATARPSTPTSPGLLPPFLSSFSPVRIASPRHDFPTPSYLQAVLLALAQCGVWADEVASLL